MTQPQNSALPLDRAIPARSLALAPALAAGLLGLFLIYGTGFAYPSLVHNAAHDARHAFAFPCH